jgi:diaminohydroxyphosphoribosylaminopyrimidine deaminase / 5-amino-6-(5-phosphoribosylamino)uracil reductase
MSAAARSASIDATFMRRALALARAGWGQTAPNPMVGAVVAQDDTVVGEGYHAVYGETHAEVNALRAAGDRARGATLYVTLEPCAHVGKTPPCTDAVIASGVARVVAAVRDPSPIARGGIERMRAAGIRVDVGVEQLAALELNAPFFHAHCSERPWVTLKLALSADGAVADPTGRQRWITTAESRAEVHRLRANSDAIAVGVGTVLADDPLLTVRDAPASRVPPRRVVFDSALRTPPDSRVVRTARAVETILIARTGVEPVNSRTESTLRAAGVTIARCHSVSDSLVWLRGRGVRALFVEGGPRLAGSFLRESLADRLVIFQSPIVLGGAEPRGFAFAPSTFEAGLAERPVIERRRFGDDVMTVYGLGELPCSPD